MGFSKDIKQEILEKRINNKQSGIAFLSGLINSSATYTLDKNDVNLCINSELLNLGEYVQDVVNRITQDAEKLVLEPLVGINKIEYVKIKFSNALAQEILTVCGIANFEQEAIKLSGIKDEIIGNEDCLKSFARGVFVGSGTTNIKIDNKTRTTTGYHIEFASKNYEFLSDFANVLAQFDIFAKLVKRKNTYVLYVKDSNEVSNILALVGAYNCVFALQNELATREMRNKANRQTNCTSANISKTIDASKRQMDAIQYLIEMIGLENLPDDLQTVALLRLANPEESLDELLKLSKIPYTKSGLNYRFQKLIKIANKMREK